MLRPLVEALGGGVGAGSGTTGRLVNNQANQAGLT
jgi:hypothetical protein